MWPRVALAAKTERVFMSTNFQFLKYEEKNQVGFLTLNREDKLNALNEKVLQELREFLENFIHEPKPINGLIFTGAGEKSFIAGADIASMSEMDEKKGEAFATLGQQVTFLFEALKIPVIAAVNGFALGGGCEMSLACDFIYATENARFALPEVSLGLIPGFGGTQRLENVIGRNYAREMVYTGRMINAEEALRIGLVNKILKTKAELLQAAEETIKEIAQKSPYAVGIAKKVMNNGNDLTIAEGLRLERERFAAIFNSYDMKEGTKAFVEKRKASFKGK
ncbi:MAG: enoyl-CoA hydratase/isomerase family protein [Bacteriovoracaceae bacterium]|nr:enoyl-CoA hydratase/isomerase family protein [Bacteriovoracaceae bacterium]